MSLHFIKTRGYLSRIHKFLFRLLGSVTANILICASLKICHKYVKFWQGKREKDIYKTFERASKGSVVYWGRLPFPGPDQLLAQVCLKLQPPRDSATSLWNIFQYFTILAVKKFFVKYNLNPPWLSLNFFPSQQHIFFPCSSPLYIQTFMSKSFFFPLQTKQLWFAEFYSICHVLYIFLCSLSFLDSTASPAPGTLLFIALNCLKSPWNAFWSELSSTFQFQGNV